jgi:DNA-binding IclR family transcriptional regulator
MAAEKYPNMTSRDSSKAGYAQDNDDGTVAPRVEQIGVQSVEIAGRILKTLASFDGPQTLSTLSQAAGFSPAKVHRYLVSLIREGFVEQNAVDGRYDFGGATRFIGRAAMNRLDVVRIGTPILSALKDELQETVFMGVWTPQGPMVIEWFDIVRPVSVILRPGSILPLHTSALGLICAAYMPAEIIERALEMETPQPVLRSRKLTRSKQVALVEDIRLNGFSLVQGELINGLDAIAVPVLNHRKELVACLAAVGSSGNFDISASGRVVRALKAAARRFAESLG